MKYSYIYPWKWSWVDWDFVMCQLTRSWQPLYISFSVKLLGPVYIYKAFTLWSFLLSKHFVCCFWIKWVGRFGNRVGSRSSSSATLVDPFHLLTTTLLSLLLPLFFLLLARLATARSLFTLATYPKPQPSSALNSLFLYTIPILFFPLVSLISVAVLWPRLYAAWIYALYKPALVWVLKEA